MPPVKFLYPLLVALLAVFVLAPLEYPGAFQSHTGLLAVYNLIDLDQHAAQFFAWTPTVGRAFDLFRGEGALPYWVAELFHLFGFSYLSAIKLVYAVAWLASGWAMYALARKFFSAASALLAATIYVYLPYHIATVYVRGAFAESVAWAVMPVALLAVWQFAIRNSPFAIRHSLAPVLAFAALFLTQPGIAIGFAPVALGVIVALQGRRAFRVALIGIGGGLVLGALLALPALVRNGAAIAPAGFSAHFVLPFQLFAAQWGFGASTGSYLDQFPLQLGVVPVGLAIIAVALAARTHDANVRRALSVFLGVAGVAVVLTFEIVAPVWKVLGLLIAAPWQLLAFAGFALALVAGCALEFDARLKQPAMLAFFVALPVVASYGYLTPRFFESAPTRPPLAVFGDEEIALWDYRIVGPLRHGATLRVQLTWQALRAPQTDYTVFVHARHEDGKTYAHDDSKPVGGALPTNKWLLGQVVTDTHTIQIDVDGPTEGYQLELGLYDAATGQRLRTRTGAEHVAVPRPGDPEPILSEWLDPKKK